MPEAPISIDRKRNEQWLAGAAHGTTSERARIRLECSELLEELTSENCTPERACALGEAIYAAIGCEP